MRTNGAAERDGDSVEETSDAAVGRELAKRLFLGTSTGNDAYAATMDHCRDVVCSVVGRPDGPYSGTSCEALRDRLDVETLPESGRELKAVIDSVATDVMAESVYPSDEACVAHLQCPPMVPGLAAEALLSALNQSLDSFDQAPAATVLEERLIEDLSDLFGLGDRANGVVTSGGTQSNLQGLLLARERYVTDAFDRSAQRSGLPPGAGEMRVVTSADAHFTVAQAAAQLGLGEDAVVPVPTDDDRRMDPAALSATLDRLERAGRRPFALVGTAGTTDFGSVDPLADLAAVAEEHGLWFHVDAALGGALAVSDAHADVLAGIERADSLALDFHKLLFQPISCGAFLLADGTAFELMDRNAAYLNPAGDAVPNLVSKSLQTTRRFDALKPYVAFRTLGRDGLAALVDRTVHLATRTAAVVRSEPAFELACSPTVNVVTFRYVPSRAHPEKPAGEWADQVNGRARERLFAAGEGVVARTEVDGRVHLKCTLMNPRTTVDDVRDLLLALKGYAAQAETGALARRSRAADGMDGSADHGRHEGVDR